MLSYRCGNNIHEFSTFKGALDSLARHQENQHECDIPGKTHVVLHSFPLSDEEKLEILEYGFVSQYDGELKRPEHGGCQI